jgi:hypothetical protein
MLKGDVLFVSGSLRPGAALVERGQKEGALREDLPKHRMVTSYFSLMHACGDDVRPSKIDEAEAVVILQGTLRASRR